ncbi:MAG TPA: amidase domain-containing protein [Bacilli bacterium]|nr:amidase domain-containing protein [Bacilli bacterium]
MYRRDWLKTVEDFFREKNRAWLTADENTLLHFLAGTPADCHSFLEVRALREAVRRREDVRYRKAKTNLQITSTAWHPEGELALVDAVETVRFYYEQGDRIEHETRRNRHRLTLMPFGDTWRVIRDESPYEKASWQEREAVPELPDLSAEEEADLRVLQETRGRYNRVAAYKYAELWWDGFNPAYKRMPDNDCTNFVSQVLHAGGIPMVPSSSRSKGWWYRNANNGWSYSWTVAHSLRNALSRYMNAQALSDPRQLKVGDIICYDWDGDNRWQHNTVVVGFDYYGYPLVNAHTVASHRRYWTYQDSYAFTSRTQYELYQIPD